MNQKTVLIVDDSPTMRQLTGFALRRLPGLRFVEAQDGAAALEVLDAQAVDLVLLDINMPVMDGFNFLERLAERVPAPPPIVIITTETAEEDIKRASRFGVVAYILKPVQAMVLAETVRDVLEGRQVGSR